MRRTSIYYNKPIYLGMIILDISEKLMNDFHYNYIKNYVECGPMPNVMAALRWWRPLFNAAKFG